MPDPGETWRIRQAHLFIVAVCSYEIEETYDMLSRVPLPAVELMKLHHDIS